MQGRLRNRSQRNRGKKHTKKHKGKKVSWKPSRSIISERRIQKKVNSSCGSKNRHEEATSQIWWPMIQLLALDYDCPTGVPLKVTSCQGSSPSLTPALTECSSPCFCLTVDIFYFLIISNSRRISRNHLKWRDDYTTSLNWGFLPTSSFLLYCRCWHLHYLIIFVRSTLATELRSLQILCVNPENNLKIRQFCSYFNTWGN